MGLAVQAEEVADTGAETEEEYEDEEEEELSMTEASVFFLDYTDQQFTVGEPVTALVSFSNRAGALINVTAVGAHLHSVYDYSYYIANFTVQEVNTPLPNGGELTLEYHIPPLTLEPIDFWLSGWVEFRAEDGLKYREAFYNSTVTLVNPPLEFDSGQAFIYLVAIGIVGSCVYFFVGVPAAGKTRAPTPKDAPVSKAGEDDWGDIQVHEQAAVSRRKRSKRKGRR